MDAPLGVFQKEEFPLSLAFDGWDRPLLLIDVLVRKLWASQQIDPNVKRDERECRHTLYLLPVRCVYSPKAVSLV